MVRSLGFAETRIPGARVPKAGRCRGRAAVSTDRPLSAPNPRARPRLARCARDAPRRARAVVLARARRAAVGVDRRRHSRAVRVRRPLLRGHRAGGTVVPRRARVAPAMRSGSRPTGSSAPCPSSTGRRSRTSTGSQASLFVAGRARADARGDPLARVGHPGARGRAGRARGQRLPAPLPARRPGNGVRRVFLAGLASTLLGFVRGRFALVLVGLVVATLGRQTAVPSPSRRALGPVAPAWRSRRIAAAAATVLAPVATYLFCGPWATASPRRTSGSRGITVLGFLASPSLFAEHVARIVLGIAVPAALVVGLWLRTRGTCHAARCSSPRHRRAAVPARPVLAGDNEPRLAALSRRRLCSPLLRYWPRPAHPHGGDCSAGDDRRRRAPPALHVAAAVGQLGLGGDRGDRGGGDVRAAGSVRPPAPGEPARAPRGERDDLADDNERRRGQRSPLRSPHAASVATTCRSSGQVAREASTAAGVSDAFPPAISPLAIRASRSSPMKRTSVPAAVRAPRSRARRRRAVAARDRDAVGRRRGA